MILLAYTYKPFPLDKWVSRLFRVMGIGKPEEIRESEIAKKLNIILTYSKMPCYSKVEGNFKLININIDLDKTIRRERFYHELCHVLRHEGSQLNMPKSFRDLQEWDAGHFTRYAAIPFHMLGEVDWKSPTLVSDMASTFKVSEEICEYRVEHIRRNMKPKMS